MKEIVIYSLMLIVVLVTTLFAFDGLLDYAEARKLQQMQGFMQRCQADGRSSFQCELLYRETF